MKKFISIAFILVAFNSYGQFKSRQITINLSPIAIQSGKYYFNGRRVNFEEIVLPLIAVQDDQINRNLKTIHVMHDIRKPLYLAPLLYYLYINNTATNATNNFDLNRKIVLGSFIFFNLFEIVNVLIKRRAINRYNDVVLQPLGLVLPGNGFSLGIRAKF